MSTVSAFIRGNGSGGSGGEGGRNDESTALLHSSSSCDTDGATDGDEPNPGREWADAVADEWSGYEAGEHQPLGGAAARTPVRPSSASASTAPPSPLATLASNAMQRHAAVAAASAASAAAASAAHSRALGTTGVSLGSRLTFQYNTRLWLALAPALLIVLATGGRPLLLCLSVAGVLSYAMDSLGSEEGSFVCVWVGLVASMISLSLSNALKPLPALWTSVLLIHCNLILLLVGVLVSLNYAFLARELLERRAERLVFACALLPITALEVLAAVSSAGITGAPWMLGLILAANYALLIVPLPSSQQLCELELDAHSQHLAAEAAKALRARGGAAGGFGALRVASGGSKFAVPSPMPKRTLSSLRIPVSELDHVVSARLAGMYAFLVVCLPYWMFLALKNNALLESLFDTQALMLVQVQVLLLALVLKEDVLWFLGPPFSSSVLLRRVLVFLSAAAFLGLLEVRVLLPVLHRYLALRAWPVLSFVVLSGAIGSAAGAAAMLLAGLDDPEHEHDPATLTARRVNDGGGPQGLLEQWGLVSSVPDSPRVKLFKLLLHISSLCVGVSFGVPLPGYVFLFVCSWAAGLVLHRAHPGAFVVATALGCLGAYVVVQRSLGFLEFGLRAQEQADHAAKYVFNSQAHMLWLLASLALLVPCVHVLFAWLGRLLADYSPSSPRHVNAGADARPTGLMLPGTDVPVSAGMLLRFLHGLADLLLLVYTFVLAALEWDWTRLDRRGAYDSAVYPWFVVLLTSALGVGLAVELGPRRRRRIGRRTAVALVTLNVWKSGVLFFDDRADFWHALLLAAATVPLFIGYHLSSDRTSPSSSTMTPRVGLAHAVLVVVAMWVCKNTVLAHALHASGLHSVVMSSSAPTESTYFALFLVGSALGMLPLSFKYFHSDSRYRRWNSLFLALSLLFFVLQPRLDFLSGSPLALSSRSDVFSRDMGRVEPRWPAWVLFGALSTLLLSLASLGGVAAAAADSSSSSRASSSAIGGWIPRPLLALALGSSMGIYLLGLYLPWNGPLYALLLAAFNVASLFLVYLFIRAASGATATTTATLRAQSGGFDSQTDGEGALEALWRAVSSCGGLANSPTLLPALYGILLALLPITYVVVGLVYATPAMYGANAAGSGGGRGATGRGAGAGAGGFVPTNSVASVLADLRTLYRVSALSVHTALHLLLALGVNLAREVATASQGREKRMRNVAAYAYAAAPTGSGIGGLGALHGGGGGGLGGLGSGAHKKHDGPSVAGGVSSSLASGEMSSLLFLGNLATLVSFVAALYLQLAYRQGTALSVLALAPLLLLLNQEDATSGWGLGWFRSLSADRKWWPVLAAAVASLGWMAGLDLFLRPLLAPWGVVAYPSPALRALGVSRSIWSCFKHAGLLFCTAPALHAVLAFLWDVRARASTLTLLLVAPINLLPLVCADLLSVQLLALLALVGVAVQAYAQHDIQRKGRRII